MITVTINGEKREWGADATESWIAQQIERRRRDGQNVCVQVDFNLSGLNMRLATPGCGSAGGGFRPRNGNEEEVFALWKQRGLDQPDFTAGNLIAFLKQFRKSAAA